MGINFDLENLGEALIQYYKYEGTLREQDKEYLDYMIKKMRLMLGSNRTSNILESIVREADKKNA